MTMEQRKLESIKKEIEKLNARLARAEKALAKKKAVADKYGVTEWSADDRRAWADAVPKTEIGFFINPEDGKKNGAWFDYTMAQSEVEDVQERIELETRRLEKITGKVDRQVEQEAEDKRLDEIEVRLFTMTAEEAAERRARREAEYEEWKKQFIAECKADGIEITEITGRTLQGFTANGKPFYMTGNSGMTMRSRHCYTLDVDRTRVFTSGDFSTVYRYLMNR